jgi:hypothetical protein
MANHVWHDTVNKQTLRELIDQVHRQNGFVPVPGATPAQSRQLMIDGGVRPEDNVFSCGILASRDEE